MCWNASVSINTYIFSVFASLLALVNNGNIITVEGFFLYQSFCTIQLIEYFVWSNTFSNKILSQLAAALILSQPLFSSFLLNHYPHLKKYLIPIIIAYLLFLMIFMYIWKPWSKVNFEMSKSENGHLSWKWMKLPLILVIVWLAFFLIPFLITRQYLLFCFTLLTAVITYIFYSKDLTWGSLWCWVANILSFVLVFKVLYKDLCF